MSFLKDYNARKKKKQNEEHLSIVNKVSGDKEELSYADIFGSDYLEKLSALERQNDIAPVGTTSAEPIETSSGGVSAEGISRTILGLGDDSLLQFAKIPDSYKDGVEFEDILETAQSTTRDLSLNALKGAGGLVEGVADLLGYKLANDAKTAADLFGVENVFGERAKDFTKRNMVDELTGGLQADIDQHSALGRTGKGIAQGIGQAGAILATGGIAASAGATSAGTSALTTLLTGFSGAGSGMSEAYEGNATDEEAATYGLIAGAADALTELFFGGMGKGVKALGFSTGLSSLDDMAAKAVSSKIKSTLWKNVVQWGVKSGFEGIEEVLAGMAQAVGKKLTYMSEKDLGQIIQDENLLEQFVAGLFTSGLTQSGLVTGVNEGSLIDTIQTGKDFITGFSQNEQAVIKAETEKRIAQQETDGKKLTKNEKRAIEAKVETDMEKGYISTDTIEEALGGEAYQNYKKIIDSEDALVKQEKDLSEESKKLEGMVWEKMTGEQQTRRDELRKTLPELRNKIAEQEKTSTRNQLKEQMQNQVKDMVKEDRLVESYNEQGRRKEAFTADLTKYDAKQQETVKKAMDSGVLNNTNRTHDFVDLIAKVAAKLDKTFDFTNNEKLKESGFALNGKVINGFVNKDGVTINIQSAKALNTVVGHEITHVLEGTDLYTELQNAIVAYAKNKGDYQSRYDTLAELYKGIEGANIDAELTADLVGDYLFTDSDFINKLSTENRNVFQKIYDEIKYLCKVVTAGSKEARELEKVKKLFDKAYREGGKATEAKTQHSLSDSKTDTDYLDAVNRGDTETAQKMVDEAAKKAGYKSPMLYHGTSGFGFTKIKTEGVEVGMEWSPFFATSNVYTAMTYSGKTGRMEIGRKKRPQKSIGQLRGEAEALLTDGKHSTTGFVGTGEENYFLNQYEDIMDNDTIRLLESGVGGAYAIDYNHTEFKFVPYEDGFSSRDYIANRGNYGLYANTDNLLVIDGEGRDWKTIRSEYGSKTRTIAENAKKAGYSGVLIKNIYDTGWDWDGSVDEDVDTASDVYIFFNPQEQVKSADPVTYDDDGNVIPLSERFNAKNEDIRFSLSDSTGNPLSNEQQEYFKDSVVRDENGNLKVMYHGTPNGDFTVFRDGTYFTPNKEYADRYQNPGASSISTGKTATNPKTFEVYLDIKKPFDISDPKARDIYINDYIKGGNAMGINPYLSDAEYAKIDSIDWTEGEDLREFLIENGYDYDGLVLDEGADGGYGNEVVSRGTSYVIFNPEQVKNIDNVKPTSNPDIRYSLSPETDKSYLDAVSRGDTETAQKMVDEVAKAAGYTQKAYHGTNADFNVFDWDETQRADAGFYGRGHYFATRKGEAEMYGSRVIPVALKNPKPFNFDKEMHTVNGVYLRKGPSSNVFTDGISFAINMAEKFPTIFGNKTFSAYDTFDYSTTDLKWSDLQKTLDDFLESKDFRTIQFSDGHYEWFYEKPGHWRSIYTHNDYQSKADAEKDKLGAAIGILFNEVYRISVPLDSAAYFLGGDMDASNAFSEELKKRGYTGVIQSDNGDEIVIFDSSNIKDASPVTHDDSGNVIPLSERFNVESDDIRYSLSEIGEEPKRYGNYNVFGKDIGIQDDLAPFLNGTVAAKAPQVAAEDLFPDDLAPVQGELSRLQEEKTALEERLYAMVEAEELGDSFTQVSKEWDTVNKRIAELEAEVEADESDRLYSFEDADAPPEAVNEQDNVVADDVPLTKKLVDDLTRSVKSALAVPAKRTAEVRKLIEEYSAKEFPGRDELYWEIADRFGTYTENQVVEELVDAKKLVRTSPINVSDFIKGEIADYGQLMRSNFGKVRFSKGGLPVDVAYKEFQEAYPDLFPEDIISPTDQLMQIIEVANKSTTFEEGYEIDSDVIWEVTDNIINSITEFKQNRREALANKESKDAFKSLMQDADQYVPPIKLEDIAPIRSDLKAQTDPDDIAPTFDTSSGQQAFMPEAEGPKKLTRKELHQNIMDNIKVKFGEKGFDFDKVLKEAKNLSTFSTVDNTPQRVMEKALGYKEGQVLSDLTVNQVAQNETEAIKWLNTFTDRKKGILAQISKRYNIKPGSKASAAAQMYAEGFYVGENDAIIEYGDKELAADFPNPTVQANIKRLAKDPVIRKIYDDTLAAINESRARNAYPEIPRLDNYFLHFRAMEDTFSKLGLPFNPNDIRAKDLPTDLNGVTADLKPGQPYFASAKHRTGMRTSFDLLGGLEKYLSSAKNQIYHIDDIQNLRALRNYIADTYGQANGLEGIDTLSEEEAQERIEKVYGSHLSTFAKFLNEEANVLAGKTSLIDRGLEGVIGRRGITFLDTVNKQVGANMVGFNVSSSLTNFLSVAQGFAKTNKFDFVKAFAQTVANKVGSIAGKTDGFTENSPVIIRRKGEERFYRTPWQKVGDAGYTLMSIVDNISTELIARAKYNELTRKGMDSQKAHIETDKWVSRLMGDRSLGQQPQLYNSKMLGLLTKFQLEVRNQLDSQFYDTIQEAKVSSEQIENRLLRNAKKAAKITSVFAQLAVGQHLFGKAFESIAGYNPAFDIIEVLIKTFGWDDEEEDEDTVLDNIEQGFLELLGDLPYSSLFNGGRVPIESALPIEQFVTGKDQYGNEKDRWETLKEAAPYYILPGGYGQIKKTMQGLDMFDEDLPVAGSYTDSGNLRFPVEDNLANRVQASLFGQYSSQNAREYFDNDIAPLKENQINEYMDLGAPIGEYWDYREGLKDFKTQDEKLSYINSLDFTEEQKDVLKSYLFDEAKYAEENPEKYKFLEDEGIGYLGYKQLDEETQESWSWAFKHPEEYKYLKEKGVYPEDYSVYRVPMLDFKDAGDAAYEWAFNNSEKATLGKVFKGGVKEYRQYSSELSNIKADRDKNGKVINGSAKQKKIAYINGLKISEGEKLILIKSLYPSDDTNNLEIVNYVKNKVNLSMAEKKTILTELGFKVSSNGVVTW